MKLTAHQLKQIIKEELNEVMGNYKQAQRASNAPFKGPTIRYYQTLADILGGKLSPPHMVFSAKHNGPIFTVDTGVNGIIQFSFEAPSWPTGTLMILQQGAKADSLDPYLADYEAGESVKYNEIKLSFPVTGYPDVDAKFIESLASLRLTQYRRFARETINGRLTPELIDRIMPGYPWDYMQ